MQWRGRSAHAIVEALPASIITSSTVTAASAFLARLKHETRSEHEAIEAQLDLVGVGLSLPVYRSRIAQFYGFYRPLELRLYAAADDAAMPPDASLRRKTPLLKIDLERLGVDASALPTCCELPDLASAEARIGCHYVLEGSTLGGQIIGRHLRHRLGITAEAGGRFFQGYGEHTGSMWQAFRAALAAFFEQSTAPQAIVVGALDTFICLRHWCAGGHGRGTAGG